MEQHTDEQIYWQITCPIPKECYKSPYDVRQLSASVEKLSIRVVDEDLHGTDRTKKCIKKVPKVNKKGHDLGGD